MEFETPCSLRFTLYKPYAQALALGRSSEKRVSDYLQYFPNNIVSAPVVQNLGHKECFKINSSYLEEMAYAKRKSEKDLLGIAILEKLVHCATLTPEEHLREFSYFINAASIMPMTKQNYKKSIPVLPSLGLHIVSSDNIDQPDIPGKKLTLLHYQNKFPYTTILLPDNQPNSTLIFHRHFGNPGSLIEHAPTTREIYFLLENPQNKALICRQLHQLGYTLPETNEQIVTAILTANLEMKTTSWFFQGQIYTTGMLIATRDIGENELLVTSYHQPCYAHRLRKESPFIVFSKKGEPLFYACYRNEMTDQISFFSPYQLCPWIGQPIDNISTKKDLALSLGLPTEVIDQIQCYEDLLDSDVMTVFIPHVMLPQCDASTLKKLIGYQDESDLYPLKGFIKIKYQLAPAPIKQMPDTQITENVATLSGALQR